MYVNNKEAVKERMSQQLSGNTVKILHNESILIRIQGTDCMIIGMFVKASC